MHAATFRLQNIISLASRERCMNNLKKIRVPTLSKTGKSPIPTAAVLVSLCHVSNQISILYTVRAANLRNDSGLISFPGGKTDRSESPVDTALRETNEEIGLSPNKIDIWGHVQALPGRNNKIMITPVIGYIKDLKKEDLCVNRNEVSDVFAAPLELLCDPRNQFYTQFQNGYILPVFVVGEFKIWGITAYITHLFMSSLLSNDVYRNEWMKKKLVINK